jgi:hypothetical protein
MMIRFGDILELVDLPNGKSIIKIKKGVDRKLVGRFLSAGWTQYLNEKYS